MKLEKWTLGLAAVGAISFPTVAEEPVLHPVQSTVQSTTISGYVNTSASLMFGPGGSTVYGRSFDGPTKQNGFNLDVVSLALEKGLDEGQWSAGYRVQMWLGPDANTLGSRSTLSTADGDFALKNAYVALRAPVGTGLDFKIGTFDTVVGYEVADAGVNPNYSRSLGFFIEPIVHTGALASYRVSEILSFSGGVATRGDVDSINARSGTRGVWSYLGSMALTAPESTGFLEGATLYAGVVDSGISRATEKLDTDGNVYATDPLNLYAGLTIPTPLTGVTLGAAWDYRVSGLFEDSYESAIAGYVSWQASEKLKLSGRADYGYGSHGTFGVPTVSNGTTADSVKVFGLTGTLDYSLFANAITRFEFRWDHMANGQEVLNTGVVDPFGESSGGMKNAMSVALNVIYAF
ncbi:MAG: outer membrane beta-barrel protein [Limisphaerales bacterium]